MAFSIVTNATIVARNAGALYNFKAGAATMASLETQYLAGGDALLNTVYVNSVGSASTSDVADVLIANLGITGATDMTTAKDYITATLNAVDVSARGAAVNSILSAFAGMTSDPTFGIYATAWNTKVADAATYGTTAATTDTTFTSAAAAATTTFILTTGQDKGSSFTGTSADDTFIARTINNGNTLQDGDQLDGGTGNDILYADLNVTTNAITPVLKNIETVSIRAQAQSVDTGDNNPGTSTTGNANVQIDAQRSLDVDVANHVLASTGVTRWESAQSRNDVIIEDVRIGNSQKTSDVTIAFLESDPGDVDYGVYFNQQSLRNTGTSTSTLSLEVMDMISVKAGTAELKDFPYDAFTFLANGTPVTLQSQGIQDAQTYAALATAMQAAADAALGAGIVTVSATGSFTVDYLGSTLTGTKVVLTASGAYTITAPVTTPPTTGWSASGIVGATSGLHTALSTAGSGTTELVTSKVVLDDVGLGSTGGDLVIGGMSTGDTSSSRGVERFEITVGDHSKLQTINSTNNALREVTIINGTTSNTVIDAYSNTADPANKGSLTVNGDAKVTTGANQTMAGVNNGATALHQGAGAAGFTDVRLIDGSAMTGKLAFTAAITVDSIGKYVNLSDTQASPTGDVAGSGNINFNVKGANFLYSGGSNNDTISVTIDAAAAASRSTIVSGQSDVTLNVSGNDGNDAITVRVNSAANAGGLQNWYGNQDLNNNITISGGAGDDTIKVPGSGDTTIDAGAGNDAIWADNTGLQTGLVTGGGQSVTSLSTGTSSNAIWLFNSFDQVNAIANGNARNIYDIRSDINDSYKLYKGTLVVAYKGITSSTITMSPTSYLTTDLDINQAIKDAINNNSVLSKLLSAQDGPGNSLIVTSMVDGTHVAGDLTVTIAAPVGTTTFSSTELSGISAAFGATYTTSAAALAAMVLPSSKVAQQDYVAAMATDAAGTSIVGAPSTSTSDNYITPGTGDDLIVLGTTEGVDVGRSSNDTVKFEPGFGNDVIVNFDNAGPGADHLDFTHSGLLGGAAGALSVAAPAGGDVNRTVYIVAETAANDTVAEIKAIFDALAGVTAERHIYITTKGALGKVYSVVDGTAAADTVVTLEGTIDPDWSLFTTLANFTVPKAFGAGSEGPDQLALGSVLTAAVTGQTIVGTALVDQISTGGFTGVNITGAGENDVFTIAAGSTGTVITDLNTGDQFNVTDVKTSGAAGLASALTATTTGFTATALTSNTTGGIAVVNTNASVALTLGAAGTLDMSLATGNLGYTLNGSAGNDTVVGSKFADVIVGGGGTDTITGGPGADNITAGSAASTIVINSGDLAPGEVLTGANGPIQVNASSTFSSVTLTNLWIWNLADGVTATITDTQFGTAGITTVVGVASGGTETLVVNAAANTSLATITTLTNAKLTLNGNDAGLTLTASPLGTTINGGAGADTIVGGAVADTLNGGAGIDIITGAAGADSMSGGAGADNFVINATPSTDTGITIATADLITDFVSGTDKISGMGVAGAGAEYTEAAAVADFATALTAANAVFNGTNAQSYYLTSITGGVGLLFINDDNNATADAVIQLTGITSANFADTDILV